MLFADDAAVATHTQEELQSLMDCFSQACKDIGLIISLKKTDTEAPPVITIDDYELDAVWQFTYLGSTIFYIFFIIKLYFQAHMQTITKAQRTHSIALHSWAI